MFARNAIVLAILVVVIAPVRASDAEIRGGPGGKPFRFTCDDGSYLVGFEGVVGDWIDRIRPLCAPWSPTERSLGKAQAANVSFGDSSGGRFPFKERCPNNYIIVNLSMTFTYNDDSDLFLDELSMDCSRVGGPPDSRSVDVRSLGGYQSGAYIRHPRLSWCGDGEAATGVRGRSGRFVDALGLVCGPAPQPITADARNGPGQQPTTLDRKILQPRSKVGDALGATECIVGYVPRLARPSDDVCVTPESHARVIQENATAASRRDPNGKYGPNSCIKGFVWREAFAGDLVCVTPEVRQSVRQENALASSRSTGATQLP